MYQSNNFDFSKGGSYASKVEREVASAQRKQDEQDYDDLRNETIAASWTAKSGQLIEVHVFSASSIMVSVSGFSYDHCSFAAIPAQYKAAGIVAKLGPVGVTAEQKAAIEAKVNSFKK